MSGVLGGLIRQMADSDVLILLANLACAASLVCAVGLLAAWLLRRQSATAQHAVLLWSIVIATISPLILASGVTAKFGWFAPPRDLREPLAEPAAPAAEDLVAQNLSAAPGAAQLGVDDQSRWQAQLAAQPVAPGSGAAATRPSVWRRLLSAIAVLWVVGTVAHSAIFLASWATLYRFRRSLAPCPDRRVVRLARKMFEALEMRPVPVVESPHATVPMCLGFFRPAIVLPEGLVDVFEPQQLRLVLLHEIAHLARRDHWVALVEVAGGILFWWNPLLVAATRSLGFLREQLCDDFVVCHARHERRYAEVLLDIAQWYQALRLPQPLISTFFGGDAGDLERRIRRLLDRTAIRSVAVGYRLAGCLALLAAFIMTPLLAPVLRADTATIGSAKPDRSNSAAGRPALAEAADALADVSHVRPETPVDLAGMWHLHLPAGFDHQIKMTRIDDTHYRFSHLTMAGIYQLRGKHLVMQKPHDPRLTEFRWELRADGSLLLVDQPRAEKTGANYLGAVMRRIDRSSQPATTPRVPQATNHRDHRRDRSGSRPPALTSC